MITPNFITRVLRRMRKIVGAERRHRFYHVQSPIEKDRFYTGPNGEELYASAFNMAWLDELGIDPKVIVDIGSYDGGDAFAFQSQFPNARVLTVEADPFRAETTRANLRGTSIEVIEAAVSSRAGALEFYRTSIDGVPSSQGSIYKLNKRAKEELSFIKQDDVPLLVSSSRIDAIVAERSIPGVDLLHMDIQGAEYDALQSLGEIRPAVIYLEVDARYEGAKRAKQIHELLKDLGYKIAADLITDRLYVRHDLIPR